MKVDRQTVIEQVEKMLAGDIPREDVGWWAYDFLLEKEAEYEPGYEKLLQDVLQSLHYFHDTEPLMRQFYPDPEEILYYLRCLKGEELYRRNRVIHWRV
ncbi:MAG: hypothetical protein CVU89_11020 [Firmicutes bacterium HGW-Firmicutes-14]|nr:MAG: hypothetical protein CVU89_11020 [Firmicutes bacterium HGW-Firmicutes-14]